MKILLHNSGSDAHVPFKSIACAGATDATPASNARAGSSAREIIAVPRLKLVPRTRSSPTIAAGCVANFGFKSGTRIIALLVSFDSEVRLRACCKAVANFGIGTLVDNMIPAVDVQRFAGDEARGVVRQERSGDADVLDAHQAARRRLRPRLVEQGIELGNPRRG